MVNGKLSASGSSINPVAVSALIAVVIAIFGAWTLWEPFGRDQGIHATIGSALLQGKSIYRDVYNVKPPATTMFHALSQILFGHSPSAIRMLDLVLVYATCLLFWRLLIQLRFTAEAALVAVLGFVALYYSQSFWTRAQTDGWAAFLLVLVTWSLMRGWIEQRLLYFAFSGAVLAFAFSLKYTVAATGLLIFAPLFTRDFKFRVGDFLAFLLGGIAVLIAWALLMVATGSLGAFVDIQLFTFGYATGVRLPFSTMFWAGVEPLKRSPLALVLIVMGLALILVALGRREHRAYVLVLWIIGGATSFLAQGKGFNYHALPLMLALSASIAVSAEYVLQGKEGSKRLGSRPLRAMSIAVLILVTSLAFLEAGSAWRRIAKDPSERLLSDYVTRDFSIPANRQAKAFLKDELGEGESLFQFGFETEFYFDTKTLPEHRFIYSWLFFADYGDNPYHDELIRNLTSDPPDLFVIQNSDPVPHVTGNMADSRAAFEGFPALFAFVTENYEKIGETPRFEYYRLTP